MKSLLIILGLLATPFAVAAQERPSSQAVAQDRERATEVMQAATSSAVKNLCDQVSELPLTASINVGRFLQILDKRGELTTDIALANETIGAPRWMDNYTCQVQLEVATPPVMNALVRMAAANPKTTPVSAIQIQRATARWPRQFIATGSATSNTIIRFRPSDSVAWRTVSDPARQKALNDAKTAASRLAMNSVSPVRLSDTKTLGDTFAVRDVGAAVDSWLSHRPVTRVDFKDDLQVEVSLGIEEHDFFNVVREAVKRQSAVPVPPAESQDWNRIEKDFSSQFKAPIGRASAGEAPPPPKAQPHLPKMPPDWINQQMQVEGSAKGAGPLLQTRAEAQRDASAKLQNRIENLKLADTTLRDLAKADPRIAKAIAQGVSTARIYKTDYLDGAVTIHLMCDMRDVWDQLRRAMPQ
jgi:hypothetical protein